MKKIKYLLLTCLTLFLLTGCVKYNANMDIKKDKSMDLSIIYALDTSLFGEQQLLEEKDKKELENQGFKITEYSKDKMKGVIISKKVKNIDEVSSDSDTEYSLSGIVEESDNNYIFKVKKGLLKNTYTAKLIFDASDSDLDNTTPVLDWSLDTDDSDNDLDWSFDTDESNDALDDNGDIDFGLDSSDMDFSNMMSNMDLSFNVTLPYSAISSNATNTNNDNKNLGWNLSSTETDTIEFEFELYNMKNIYIGIGIIVLIIVVILTIIISKKKNNKKENLTMNPINNQQIKSEQSNNEII